MKARQTAALFIDSSTYRAQCKEADTQPKADYDSARVYLARPASEEPLAAQSGCNAGAEHFDGFH
jgi:hypothetical protein